MNDIFKGYGVEVTLTDAESFLKVRETLTRIGIASKKDKKLWQSCHILHKQGRYVIIHFLELMELDGRQTNLSEEDLGRRNMIASLLEDWGLVAIVDKDKVKSPKGQMSQVKILPYGEKADWELTAKYTIGRKK